MPTPEWPLASQASEVVLHRTPDGWRFAIVAGETTIDGRLDVPTDTSAEQAKAALIDIVERQTGQTVTVEWTKNRSNPDAWSTDIAINP